MTGTSGITLIATFLIAACAHSVWAQGTNTSNDPPAGSSGSTQGNVKKTNQYSGGGIRGALPQVPDGWLVTADEAREYRGEDGFNEEPALRPRAVVPLIDILKPEPVSDLKVKAPFAISVQFKNQPDVPIDPATFRLLYGALKIDITSRITGLVNVTKEGFSLASVQLPAGKHRFTLQVQDEKQRVAERELRVDVE